MAAKVVKMCDLHVSTASVVFKSLNSNKIELKMDSIGRKYIVTDIEPRELIYPEGWYYAKGCFRNKHTSTSGVYEEIVMIKSNGDFWSDTAKYCTLYD